MLGQQLFKTIIVVHFSVTGSSKPLQTVIQRLVIISGFGLFLAVSLSRVISRAILPYGFPTGLVFCLTLAVGFILGGFICLATNSVMGSRGRTSGLAGILSLLSISKVMRWVAHELPMLVVLSTVGIIGGILVYATVQTMLASTSVALAGWLLGLYSGFGCMLLRLFDKPKLSVGLFIGIVVFMGGLFDRLFVGLETQSLNATLAVIGLILLLPLLGHLQLFLFGGLSKTRQYNFIHKPLIPDRLPYSAWYLIKLVRNKRTRTSLFIALVLSTTGALSVILRSNGNTDPYQLLLFGSILAATFACDCRGIIRKYSPPEIVVLAGVGQLVKSELWSASLIGILIGLPMAIALVGGTANWAIFLFVFIAIQVFSALVGLMASTLLVPQHSDTGSQFIAAILAISTVVMAPRIGGLSNSSRLSQVLVWVGGAVGLGFGIYLIEIRRRRHYGRA